MHTFVLRKCRIAIVNPSCVSNSTSHVSITFLLYFFSFVELYLSSIRAWNNVNLYIIEHTFFSAIIQSFFFFSSKKNKEEQQLLSCALIHFITVHFTVCIFWNTVGVLIITCTINFWIFISGIMLDVILIYIEN